MDSNGFAQRLLEDQLVRQELEEMNRPHVLVCTDTHSGQLTLSGPFADGVTALAAAEADARAMDQISADHTLVFRVQPLYEPLVS